MLQKSGRLQEIALDNRDIGENILVCKKAHGSLPL